MKDATLAQGNQVLNLILQKRVPVEQLQAVIQSGLFSDLLDANLEKVSREEFRRVCGLKPLIPTFTLSIDPAKPFVYDKTKDGWKLESDIKYQAGEVELELAEFLNSGEFSVSGTEMTKRAIRLNANLGQKHAEAFLAKYERWTPPEGVFYIIFPGTVWQGEYGDRHVACLGWNGGRWCLYFRWLEYDWGSSDRVLRLRK